MSKAHKNLFDEYLNGNELFDFVQKLSRLSDQDKSKIIRELKTERDRNNFRSKLSEIRFGLAFAGLQLETYFERSFNHYKPDWTCILNGKLGLFEVYRLNRSEKDSLIFDLETRLCKEIEKIQRNVYLEINILNAFHFDERYMLNEIISQIENWLTFPSVRLNDTLNIAGNIEVRIVKTNTGKTHVLCCSGFRLIEQKPHKLEQKPEFSNNEITKKLLKYIPVLRQNMVPYFLCVEIDFISGFHYSDFEEYFLYKSTEFIDYHRYMNRTELGQTWSDLGKFYDAEIKNYLSGLIILDNKRFQLLLNPFKKQIIYSGEYKGLLSCLQSIDKMIPEF